MARIRTIKPTFFISTSIAQISYTTRLTFVGLWTYVDDSGRGVDDKRLIKAALWPLDDKHGANRVEADLVSLEKHGFIERYTHDGRSYLRIRNWTEHQRIDKPQQSKLPPSPEEAANVPGSFHERSKNDPGTLPPKDGLERKGKERKGIPPTPLSEEPPAASESAGEGSPSAKGRHVPAQVVKALRLKAKSDGWAQFTSAMKQYEQDGTVDEFVELAERFPSATPEQLPVLAERGPLFRQFVEQVVS